MHSRPIPKLEGGRRRRGVLAALLLALALFLVLPPQAAHAQASVTTDVDINLPSILILFCYDEIDVTITAANLATLLLGAGSTGEDTSTTLLGTVTPAVSGTNLEGTVITLDTTITGDPTAVFLNLLEVCGIRAIGNGSGVDVSIAQTANTTLAGPVAGTSMEVDAVATRSNSVGGAWGNFNIPEADLGLGNVNLVDAQLELDLTNAGAAGDYSSAASGTFTISAVAP